MTTGLPSQFISIYLFTACLLFGPVSEREYTPSWFRPAFAAVNIIFGTISIKAYLDELAAPFVSFEKLQVELRNAKKLSVALNKFGGSYDAIHGWISSQEVCVTIVGVDVDNMLPNKVFATLVSGCLMVGLVLLEKMIK